MMYNLHSPERYLRNNYKTICQQEDNGFTPEGSKWEQETSCNYCRKEDYDDHELLDFALNKLNLNRNELIELLKTKGDVK